MQLQTFSDDNTIPVAANNLLANQLLQALPAAVYTCDADGYIQLYNKAAVELWGREPIAGKDQWCGSWKIYKMDGSPLPLDECPMAITLKEGREVRDQEIIVEKPNGERRVIMPFPQPIFDNSGRIAGAINMLVDITEKKDAEKSVAWLAALIHSSEDAIISKTLNGIVTSWNPAAERMFGYRAEEMIGQPITRLIPPDRLNEETHIIERISRGELVEHFNTVRLTSNNEMIDISLTISPIRNSKGDIIGASKIARDITRNKQAEEKLRQSEKYLNELANAMSQLVWISRPDGKVVYFNDRILEYEGMEKPADGAWNWVRLIHPDDLTSTVQDWNTAIANGSVFAMEHRLQMKDTTYRWHLSRIIPYEDEKGNISKWIGTATDIDDIKQMALRKDDFLSVASHELRTPITSIKAYSQLLVNTYKHSQDEFLKNALAKLEVQANKMTKLVTDFLKLSKIESGKLQLNKETFCINDLVNETVADIQLVSVNHKIIVGESERVNVTADRERIAQVIANFLNNAVKYSPGAEQILVSYKPGKNSITINVTDKGVGIKPEEHDKIFERFYRAKSNGTISFSGFGIGLYISAEIIQRHNGEIGVNSDEGKGSTFYFTLPLA
ncbi:MAG TPA: PAS domain S-box protein [Chitinophagaceae bacterium]|nr:PAS domain S-box protein [Chitinophagaceae bacterium]